MQREVSARVQGNSFHNIGAVNGLRGLAILSVLSVHTLAPRFAHDGEPSFYIGSLPFSFGSIACIGWIGVNVFFMLSGFVLYLPFAGGTDVDVKGFYARRVRRLAPLYLIVGLLSVLLFTDNAVLSTGLYQELAYILTTGFYWFEPYFVRGNPPMWSIAIEIYLSLAFPFLVMLVRRKGWLAVLVATGVLAPLLRIGYAASLGVTDPPADADKAIWHFLALLQAANEFLLGAWLAHLYRSNDHARRGSGLIALGAILAILAIVGLSSTSNGAPTSPLQQSTWLVIDPLLALALAGSLTLSSGVAYRLLTNRPLQLLGMMCYSIYMWHVPLLNALKPGGVWWLTACASYALSILIVIGFAAVSYRFIEFPTRPWRSLLPARRVAALVDAPVSDRTAGWRNDDRSAA